MLAAITALLGIVEGVVGIEKIRELKEFISKVVDVEKSIADEMQAWPNVDDAKLEALWKERDMYEDALAKQAMLLNTASH